MPKLPDVSLEDSLNSSFEPYANAVGKVAHSWNALQEELAYLFSCVTEMDDSMSRAIWYSTQNDRAQREMLRAALSVRAEFWEHPQQVAKDIVWLIDRANALADQRNDAIHAPCSIMLGDDGFEVTPAYFYGNPRAQKLRDKDLLEEFAWCEASAEALTLYAKYAATVLSRGHGAWPERPLMPTRGQTQTRKGSRRQADAKPHQPPPQSSGG